MSKQRTVSVDAPLENWSTSRIRGVFFVFAKKNGQETTVTSTTDLKPTLWYLEELLGSWIVVHVSLTRTWSGCVLSLPNTGIWRERLGTWATWIKRPGFQSWGPELGICIVAVCSLRPSAPFPWGRHDDAHHASGSSSLQEDLCYTPEWWQLSHSPSCLNAAHTGRKEPGYDSRSRPHIFHWHGIYYRWKSEQPFSLFLWLSGKTSSR